MTAVGLADLVDPLGFEAAALAEPGALDPELAPCATCGIERIAHVDTDAGHPHQMPPAWTLALTALEVADRQVMDDIVEHANAGYVPSGKFGPRVSDAGACRRQIWYRENPPAGYTPRPDGDQRAATLGGLIHKAGEQARRIRYPWRRFEFELNIPGLDKPGRVDEYDPILGIVADTKSAGHGKWGMIGDDGPDESMWRQVRIYALTLDMLGAPVRTLQIMAINRADGGEEWFIEDYDPERCQDALDDLVAIATAIEAGATMPRDGYGPADFRCKYCRALEHCWNTDAAARLDRHPVSLTLLGEKPADDDIVWAGLTLLEATERRKAAEAVEDRAKELVGGIPKGPYGVGRDDGGIVIGRKPTTGAKYKDAWETVTGYYALAYAGDPDAPAPDTLPPVEKTTTYSTTVSRPRAADQPKNKRRKKPTKADHAAAVIATMTGETPADA